MQKHFDAYKFDDEFLMRNPGKKVAATNYQGENLQLFSPFR